MAEQNILVVANRTLGGQHLVDAVRERVRAGATGVWIVVPATPPPDDETRRSLPAELGFFSMPADEGPVPPDAYELAERRLEQAKGQFTTLGVRVGGEVGDQDPLKAIGDVLSRRQVDEVIISILPRAVSQWLHVDLPSRARRKFSVPVTTVTAPAPQRG